MAGFKLLPTLVLLLILGITGCFCGYSSTRRYSSRSSSSSSGSILGTIIGILVGCGILAAVIVACCCCRRRIYQGQVIAPNQGGTNLSVFTIQHGQTTGNNVNLGQGQQNSNNWGQGQPNSNNWGQVQPNSNNWGQGQPNTNNWGPTAQASRNMNVSQSLQPPPYVGPETRRRSVNDAEHVYDDLNFDRPPPYSSR